MAGQVIWVMGLSGAGKTTLANELTARLRQGGLQPILLDGDILRNLFKVSGITIDTHNRESRIKLALKYALMCELLSSQGFTVVIATISMFDEVYAWNRETFQTTLRYTSKCLWKNYGIETLRIYIEGMKVEI